jgi:hypothetical protein
VGAAAAPARDRRGIPDTAPMRPRILLPCAAALAALAGAPSAASAASAEVECKPREGVQVTYVRRAGAGTVTCSSAFAVLFKGILDHRPPSGWTCRQPADRFWPVVETCERRTKGRVVVTADLLEVR